VGDRLRGVLIRLGFGAGQLASFALGSIGGFLAFQWPPLLRGIVLGYLLAFLVVRLILVIARFLFAPYNERFRITPMSTAVACFWFRRLGLLVGWFAFGWATVELLETLGVAPDARRVAAYSLGLGLLALGLEAVWRQPRPAAAATAGGGGRLGHRGGAWLVSIHFVLLWGLWVLHLMNAFWLAVAVVAVPAAIGITQRSVNHLLRPSGEAAAPAAVPSLVAVCLERGLRAVILIGAVLALAHAWDIDLVALTARDTMFTRLLRGALSAVVILLVADFAWHAVKSIIDRKLVTLPAAGSVGGEDARRQARLRTLLPILRNVLFIVFAAIAALMALSAVGVEVGPLIAGAGVVGVAIGFGAQTLVKDIISGMFFLLDDAFRVGEYVQSGNYKGTVESFSLRSIKLRHHRGPLYTVPFGELGAIQNMSRDWVIDKLNINVTYDSDLNRAKKLIKQVGQALTEDPELAPHILQTLKMQGVDQFGDYGISIRLKMMTKPGEQFVIRRRAYAMIKKEFDANGIKFAFPTVQVAGGEEGAGPGAGAVARQGLELVHPPGAPGS
jgi:small-conductance mechanosensitive channel